MEPITEATKVNDLITIAPQEIPACLKRGKTYLAAGQPREAIKYFSCILKVDPGNMETRVWLQKAKQAPLHSEAVLTAEEEKPHYCVYMMMKVVSHHLCICDYNCYGCEFNQQMEERIATRDTEIIEALERYKSLPGTQKLCRYALKGNISYRLCSQVIECAKCEFNQMMEDAFEQQTAQRMEAVHIKKQHSWWWSYWQ